MKSALVENELVTNIAVGLAEGYIECPKEVQIGWNYIDGEFSAPVIEEPVIEEIIESE